MKPTDRQSLVLISALSNQDGSKALEILVNAPECHEALVQYFGPEYVKFQQQYDSLPPDELVRQYVFNLKFKYSDQFNAMLKNALKKIKKPKESTKIIHSSHLDGVSPGNISTSVFGGTERVHTESFMARHAVDPNQEYDVADRKSSVHNSLISTTIVTQEQTKPRSRSANSLSNILLKTKQNEIERIKLNKQYNQLCKELEVSEKAIKQSQQQYQSIFKQIRQLQQINMNLQKKRVVGSVAEQSGKNHNMVLEKKLQEAKQQLREIDEAIQQVTRLNEDYKLQIFGEGQTEQLDNLFQQMIAITEENVFIAGKEDQVVIYQEILQNDEKRTKLVQKQKALKKRVEELEHQVKGYRELIGVRTLERSQL